MMFKRTLPVLLLLAALTIPYANGQVTFSAPGGFYQHTVSLTLSAEEGLSIHYTTDGALPTTLSPCYGQPLTLSPSLYSSRDIYLMPDAPEADWNPPTSVHHVIVLRAAAFDSQGVQVGPVATHTYLIADLMEHQPQLPAVSIALDYTQLFDSDSGIFSPNGFDPEDDFNTGNFNQHGREWERLASVEFYELDNTGFAQELGLRVHGGKTRRHMQKPLKLYARKEYGNKKIDCPLFEELSYTSFKRLVLKPFSAAWTDAGIQDWLASQIARPLRFVSLASRPVTLYINGEYWGIYYLQEAPDERLIEQLDDVDADDVNIIGSWLGLVENGNNSRFRKLMQWLETADLSDTLQYQYLCSLIDIEDFIDYHLFEAFIANEDWPANNMRCYQHDNSLWRWIFYDGDGSFTHLEHPVDQILTYQGEEQWPSCKEATLCLRRCLQSLPFVERFGNRLYQLASTNFDYANTAPLLQRAKAEVASEIEWQSQRFHFPGGTTQWERATNRVDEFLSRRPDIFVSQIEKILPLPADTNYVVRLYPNPAHRLVNISISSGDSGWVQCHIYDALGRQIMRHAFFANSQCAAQIPLSTLSAGVYSLRLSNSDTTYRLIVY